MRDRTPNGRRGIEPALAAALRRYRVRGRLLLAVSGGADSTALLRAAAVAGPLGIDLAVAHFDHALRADSDRDAAWVAAAADRLGLPCLIGRGDVIAETEAAGRGLEETARRLRYEFLTRAALSLGAAYVATAHTADDQAETVLFHLLRGTGLRGLRGIPGKRLLTDGVTLIRPLLDVSRAEIEGYLSSIDQPHLTDPTNASAEFMRNRLRNDLLPQLRTVNPQVDAALGRLARQADEASNAVRRAASGALRAAVIEASPSSIRLRCDGLRRRPRAVLREAIVLAWTRAGWPRQAMTFDHWDGLADIVLHGGRRTLPDGVDARRARGELVLARPAR